MLGIAVVYLFGDDNAALFDLHVERIARHTHGPYRIYGGVNRLPAASLTRVAAHPHVRPVTCPETGLRGAEEHGFYLDHLVQTAFADGVSHAAVMHLDSFPIADGWDRTLMSVVSGRCAFATIARIDTALLFVQREFYTTCHPKHRLTAEEERDPRCQAYLDAEDPEPHSGIGYGYRAFTGGWTAHYLHPPPGWPAAELPYVFGDLVFHLNGGVKLAGPAAGRRPWLARYVSALNVPIRALRARLPPTVRLALRARWAGALGTVVDNPRWELRGERMRRDRARLLADPDAFIAWGRAGR